MSAFGLDDNFQPANADSDVIDDAQISIHGDHRRDTPGVSIHQGPNSAKIAQPFFANGKRQCDVA
jgi:hypothetical protein